MVTNEEVNEALDAWQEEAFRLYGLMIDRVQEMGVEIQGKHTPNGLEARALSGTGLLLSPSEVSAIQHSMSWAFALWMSSGVLPDAHHLSGYVQSMGGGQAASISTLCSIVVGVSGVILSSSGSEDLVSHVSDLIAQGVVPTPTSPNMSAKKPATLANTVSSPQIGRPTGPTQPPAVTTSRRKPATKDTSTRSGNEKKKTGGKRKSPTRKGIRKKKGKRLRHL